MAVSFTIIIMPLKVFLGFCRRFSANRFRFRAETFLFLVLVVVGFEARFSEETFTPVGQLQSYRHDVIKWNEDDDDDDDDNGDGDDYLYPKTVYRYGVLRCMTYDYHKEIVVEQKYTVKLSTSSRQGQLEVRDRSKSAGTADEFCQCSPLLEIKCRGGLVDFPRFEEKIVIRSGGSEDWEGGSGSIEVVDNNKTIYKVYNVARQSISVLGPNSFAFLKLQSVVVNHNPIGDAVSEMAFVGLRGFLKELQLGACKLRLLPDKLLAGLVDLVRLHMWGNKISKIPVGFFKEAANLRELVLWGNEIEELEDHTLAGLWNLRRLDLDRNRIQNLSTHAFRHLIELEFLQLDGNRITTIHGKTFSFMSQLKVLSLDRNCIVHLYSEAFNNLHNLLILSLKHNQIGFLPQNLFTNLQNLTRLWLSNNSVELHWNSVFSGLRSLHELRLAGNQLKSLPDELFRNLNRLRHLVLDDNEFKSLVKYLFPKRFRLKNLSLLGNPLQCNCESAWLGDHCHTFTMQDHPTPHASHSHQGFRYTPSAHETPIHPPPVSSPYTRPPQQPHFTYIWGTCINLQKGVKSLPYTRNICWMRSLDCPGESQQD